MRCDHIREKLSADWGSEQASEVRQHLAQCAACSRYQRDLRLVREGFRLLREEEIPEPSCGFAERLVRQLDEMSRVSGVADFFERVGRRFVFATLVLTFLTLLALVLPPTGPIRGLNAADVQITAQDASLSYSDPMGPGPQESSDSTSWDNAQPTVTDEVK